MSVPTKSEWGHIDAIDIESQYAFDMFFGKTLDEAMNMCESAADNYQEELQSMPRIPFNFYAPVLSNYIVSEKAKKDADGASCYLSFVSWMLRTKASIIKNETRKLLINSARYVSENQEFYDATQEIYGCFKEKYAEIEKCI